MPVFRNANYMAINSYKRKPHKPTAKFVWEGFGGVFMLCGLFLLLFFESFFSF